MLEAFSAKRGFYEHKQTAIILLNNIIKILNEFNIEYFLISGTLLGFVRHNDFIPWDDDIDLMVNKIQLESNMDKIIAKYQDLFNIFHICNYYYKICNNVGALEINNKSINNSAITKNNKYNFPYIDLFTYTYTYTYTYDTQIISGICFFHKIYPIDKFFPLKTAYFNFIKVNIPQHPEYFLKYNYGPDYMNIYKSSNYNHRKEEKINEIFSITKENYKEEEEPYINDKIHLYNLLYSNNTGTEIKLLQYKPKNIIHNVNTIDLIEIINTKFFPMAPRGPHLLLINIEKDTERYLSTVEELKKLSINNFVHLLATYWKNKAQLTKDLNCILNYINKNNIQINDFSEINDSNINIEDGPLACYCSHIRALIYGFHNFENYTIICEDDCIVYSTDYIKYINDIPEDWDIICLNAIPKNNEYLNKNEPYKFNCAFHSTQFYIVKNNVIPLILQNIYPIYEQIDILIADMYNKINIYNIPNTVYQKKTATNTQNNLHTIYNSNNYEYLRILLNEVQLEIFNITNEIISSGIYNKQIADYIFFDLILLTIQNFNSGLECGDQNLNKAMPNKDNIYIKLAIIFEMCIKTEHLESLVSGIINEIYNILNSFNGHNDEMPYFYGSTANVYIGALDRIIKKYNKKLKWVNEQHFDSDTIFNNELQLLKLQEQSLLKLINYSIENKTIELTYCGESLYNNWNLPLDYKEQLNNIFNNFDKIGIYYPEFRIQNILVNNGIITLCDFGLASFNKEANNTTNCAIFCELLEILNNRFANESNNFNQHLLYNKFINNMKILNKYPNNIF
jgi:phosphorylcholine metabolism protein LicD